jgi:transcriptional regulator with XRE-family HTH domain
LGKKIKNVNPVFGAQLQKILTTRPLKPVELAAALDVTENTVNNWLRGTEPSVSNRQSLAKFLNVSESELVFGWNATGSEDESMTAWLAFGKLLSQESRDAIVSCATTLAQQYDG